jgi:hypothetical protein
MSVVKIYRKSSGMARPKATKADHERFARMIETRAIRVERDSLAGFFIPAKVGTISPFYKLPELSPSLVANRAARIMDHADAGWIVPLDSLGRGRTADASTAQSILLWIKKNLSAFVNADDVSVVVE